MLTWMHSLCQGLSVMHSACPSHHRAHVVLLPDPPHCPSPYTPVRGTFTHRNPALHRPRGISSGTQLVPGLHPCLPSSRVSELCLLSQTVKFFVRSYSVIYLYCSVETQEAEEEESDDEGSDGDPFGNQGVVALARKKKKCTRKGIDARKSKGKGAQEAEKLKRQWVDRFEVARSITVRVANMINHMSNVSEERLLSFLEDVLSFSFNDEAGDSTLPPVPSGAHALVDSFVRCYRMKQLGVAVEFFSMLSGAEFALACQQYAIPLTIQCNR